MEPGESVDGREMTVIYLVSSFGFSGSPGEWTVWGKATEEFLRAHGPAQPRRDLTWGFDSQILVDDNVLVEPWIGLRPWVAGELGVKLLLGEAAVNRENAIEGPFRTFQTVWGLDMDTTTEEVQLPNRRVLKGAELLADGCFDYGCKDLTLRAVQRFRGITTGWSSDPSSKVWQRRRLRGGVGWQCGIDGVRRTSGSTMGDFVVKEFEKAGWEVFSGEFVTTEFGEAAARRRRCVVAPQTCAWRRPWTQHRVRESWPHLAEHVWTPYTQCLEKVEIDTGIPRDPLLPVLKGHCSPQLVGTSGPILWPLKRWGARQGGVGPARPGFEA